MVYLYYISCLRYTWHPRYVTHMEQKWIPSLSLSFSFFFCCCCFLDHHNIWLYTHQLMTAFEIISEISDTNLFRVLCVAVSWVWSSSERPIEGIFPLELAWVLTPFPKTLLDESINRGLVCRHMHSIAQTQKILKFMSQTGECQKQTTSMHHPWRQNVTTSMLGL